MYTLLLSSISSVPVRALRFALFVAFVALAAAVHFEMESPFLEFAVIGAGFLALDIPLSKVINQTSVFSQMQTRKELPGEAAALLVAGVILQIAVWVKGSELGIPLEAGVGSLLWLVLNPLTSRLAHRFAKKSVE